MSIRNSLLFGLSLLDTILKEFHDPGGFISYSYKNMYGFIPISYKRKSLYSVIHSLKRDENILTASRGKFKLTSKGRQFTIDAFPNLKFLNKKWDGKWRIVGFDIEEKSRSIRNKFRKFLYRFGFGMLQESLYISPLPIEEDVDKFLSSNKELFQNAYIFVSDKFFLGDNKMFIEKVFGMDVLNVGYQNLLEKVNTATNEKDNGEIIREFLKISLKDPFLPEELLESGFARNKVWSALIKNDIITF